jgi:large subunit ribosomal protein L28
MRTVRLHPGPWRGRSLLAADALTRTETPGETPRHGLGTPPKLYSPAMSKVCHVCSKGPAFGHSRSHSLVATKRRFEPNLQRVRIDDHGTPRRVYVCTRCLKAGKVVKAR